MPRTNAARSTTSSRRAIRRCRRRGRRSVGAAENQLSGALGKLIALSEAYPDLKANANFQQLANELSDLENKIAASRRFFNNAVQEYNTGIQQMPAALFAGMFGFTRKDFFDLGASRTEVEATPTGEVLSCQFRGASVIPARANPESRSVHPISGFRVRMRLTPPAPRNDEGHLMAAYGLYTHIASNKFRSMLLLAGLFVLIYVLVLPARCSPKVVINSDGSSPIISSGRNARPDHGVPLCHRSWLGAVDRDRLFLPPADDRRRHRRRGRHAAAAAAAL